MPNFTQSFRAEIIRLAKKQAKAISVALVSEIRKLKQGQKALRGELKAVKKQIVFCGGKKQLPKIDAKMAEKARLSPGLLKKLRTKLGVSQADMAKLVGVSTASIVLWESGKTVPTKINKAKIVALRGLGKRELQKVMMSFAKQ